MVRPSHDSAQRPLSDVQYHAANNPYGSGDPYYQQSSGFVAAKPQTKGQGTSKWIKFGVPLAILVVVGAVLGGVLGSRAGKKAQNNAANGNGQDPAAAASSAASIKALGRLATATDTYGLPIYPSTTNTALFSTPTFGGAVVAANTWPKDTFQPSNPSPTGIRPDRPRVIAPAYKWAALPHFIATDPYLKGWNDTIFGNGTTFFPMDPVPYYMDGSSGILDVARQVKVRVKTFAYIFRLTNDTKWVDRTWAELQNAADNGTTPWGTRPDIWNSGHFLDTAELSSAFGIAYDWLYDAWTPTQREQIMWTIINYGLSFGITHYTNPSVGWWTLVNGNWNCVCNAGMTIGALAILGDDPSGTAAQILGYSTANAPKNCAMGPSTDGTWSETANYWYFGTTGHAEMSAALLSATGSSFNMLSTNAGFNLTSFFHIHVHGMTSLFNYGDHGPNKYSATANGLIFYGSQYSNPFYTLYQRDQIDAAEPWSMFWYDPSVAGAWWDGLALDHYFDNNLDQWAAMRSSWTNNDNGVYVAMKAGNLTNHQTHGDLDAGDFVLDAMGQRWAGELGSGDYLAPNYFSNETQTSERWLYYRKMTAGQNTLLLNNANQDVLAQPTCQFGSTGDAQGSSTVMTIPDGSTAFFTTDLTQTYFGQSVKRGIRFINNRRQVLIQDDITAVTQTVEWRMHTNATVAVDTSGTSATLTLSGKTLTMQILNPPTGAAFTTGPAERTAAYPPLPAGSVDQPNPGVTVVSIKMAAGTYSLQVLFNPQWSDLSASQYKTPPAVPIGSWSLTSHNN
ncbi:hypothetical protein BOTBODRAFT_159293 [Botryobasidium botryosum FD-172 SS1]|uniref:Heparinase II/III-like C-terminal domain-containing protein n=1 Tax=Botryobasidium botryosum (strain FD-172 SS1) TaxID=930990 RepID=A0A067MSA3_BOTB1|nr:hypothetical protein BOTBODRAFT_159293 [Botryobasidium botryosum FD-172 SS1]